MARGRDDTNDDLDCDTEEKGTGEETKAILRLGNANLGRRQDSFVIMQFVRCESRKQRKW